MHWCNCLTASQECAAHGFAHKMAANNTWEAYKQKMKDKRLKKGKALPTCKGLNSGDLILQKGEIVVQRLSAEVSGKAQKYNIHGPREFVSFGEEELSIPAIKNACEKHFRALTSQGLVCDVLAGDRGPSCSTINQIPDLKVSFIKRRILMSICIACAPHLTYIVKREESAGSKVPILIGCAPLL